MSDNDTTYTTITTGMPPQAGAESLVAVISDIHIGDNSNTVWYQRDIHEQYLVSILDWIADNPRVQEVVLLGDVVDFWTYPFDRRPPTFGEITAANPNIFGQAGALARLLDAKGGRVTYVVGNHDMGVTPADVATITSPGGHAVQFGGDSYSVPSVGDPQSVLMTHGNRFTMFNAVDPHSPWNGLPVGHFITRMVATMWSGKLAGTDKTVADLPGQGAPNGMNLTGVVEGLLRHMGDVSLSRALLDSVATTTGVGQNEPILLPVQGQTTLAQVGEVFSDLWTQWVAAGGGGQEGLQYAGKAALADGLAYYLGWFAQRAAFEQNSRLVVMGHTHTPIAGLDNQTFVNYLNSGFECPSVPDMGSQPMSFVVFDREQPHPNTWVLQAAEGSRTVVPCPAATAGVVAGPSMDYSCYVSVYNPGPRPLTLRGTGLGHGYWVVPPPETIGVGEVAKIWLQDFTGIHGSDGWFEYTHTDSDQVARYSFDCPTGLYSNTCSGGSTFSTAAGDGPWSNSGTVVKRPHPFFVAYRAL